MIGSFKVQRMCPVSKRESTRTNSSNLDNHKQVKHARSAVYPLAVTQAMLASHCRYIKPILKSPIKLSVASKRVTFKNTIEVFDKKTSYVQQVSASTTKTHCCIIV